MSLNTNDPEKVGKFVNELCIALTKDMTEIRETELDHPGEFRKVRRMFSLKFEDLNDKEYIDVFVDRLGRILAPPVYPWPELGAVQFSTNDIRLVVKTEKRYEGDKIVAYVIYLEAKEGEPHA